MARNHLIKCKVDSFEKETIRENAQRIGMPLGTFIRHATLTYSQRQEKINAIYEALTDT